MARRPVERVSANTAERINEEIRWLRDERLRRIVAEIDDMKARLDAIERRLRELDDEWDVERTLQANAATVFLVGSFLSWTVSRKWAVLPLAAAGFLLQHAVQGWCPPLPVFRRMGVRTAREIAEERFALKAIRGDFDPVTGKKDAERVEAAIAAVR